MNPIVLPEISVEKIRSITGTPELVGTSFSDLCKEQKIALGQKDLEDFKKFLDSF